MTAPRATGSFAHGEPAGPPRRLRQVFFALVASLLLLGVLALGFVGEPDTPPRSTRARSGDPATPSTRWTRGAG